MSIFSKIIKNGNLINWASNAIFFCGVACIGWAIYFAKGMLLYFLMITGLLIAAVAGLDSKAKVLRLKPFTRDPLGWRQAKATYKSKTAGGAGAAMGSGVLGGVISTKPVVQSAVTEAAGAVLNSATQLKEQK